MVLGGQKKSCFGEVAVVQKRLLQYIIQSVLQISVLETCPDNYAPAMKWRRVYNFTLHHSSICVSVSATPPTFFFFFFKEIMHSCRYYGVSGKYVSYFPSTQKMFCGGIKENIFWLKKKVFVGAMEM